MIVAGSAIRRRSEQSANLNSLMWLGFGIGIIYFWGFMLNRTNEKANENQIARETRIYNLAHGTREGTAIGDTVQINPIIISTDQPTQTITATLPPTPSPTGTEIYSVNYIFTYSYYNPKLGGVNCYQWDAAKNDCISMLANGEDWHNQYGKVVACPPEIALGTIIEVMYPDALKGYWTCKDRGSLITGKWIDFLDITQRAQWGESVSARLYPPTVPMEQITKGTH